MEKMVKKVLTKDRGHAIMDLPLRRGLFLSRTSSCEGDKILGIQRILLSGGVSEWLREIELELHWHAANASRETTTL